MPQIPLPFLSRSRSDRHRFRALPVLLLLTALAVAPAALAQPDGAVVRGAVVDLAGGPVAGSAVELVPVLPERELRLLRMEGRLAPEPVDGDRSGPDGAFQVTAPGPGMWRLVVRPATKGGPSVPLVHELEPLVDDTVLPSVKTPAGRSLAVTVVDAAGRPASGVLVEWDVGAGGSWWRWRQQGWAPLERLAFTDSRGRATLPLEARENGRVRAWVQGSPLPGEGEVGPDDGAVTVRLPAPGSTSRTLEARFPDGSPAPGVLVSVGESPLPAGRTGPDGRWTLDALPPGSHRFHLGAQAGWSVAGSLAVAEPKEEEEAPAPPEASSPPVPVTLLPPWDVAGRVLDGETGEPLADALAWPVEAPSVAVATDHRGVFRLLIPEPDEDGEVGEVRVATTGYRTGRRLPSGTPEMLFQLEPQPLLRGRVVDPDGEPVADVRVRLRQHDPDVDPAWTVSDELPGAWTGADGRFRLTGLDPDTLYDLRLEAAGYAPAERTLAPPADEVVQLSLDGAVQGVLVDGYGEPVPGVVVRLFEPPGPDGLSLFLVSGVRRSDLEATSGVDGRFVVSGVPAGSWELEALADGWVPVERTGLEVEPTRTLDLGRLVLEPAAQVEGQVVDEAGEPISGVRVELSSTSRFAHRRVTRTHNYTGETPPVFVRADDEGRFRITALGPSDPVTLSFHHHDYPQHSVDGVTPEGPPLEVVMPTGARVFGRVLGPDGQGVPRATVNVVMEVRTQTSAGSRISAMSFYEQTDAEGSFESDSLPPGEVTVEVRPDALPGGKVGPITVAAGERVGPVEITLGEPRVVEGRVLGPAGGPAGGAEVRAETAFGTTRGVTDAEGLYRLENVQAGAVKVIAEQDGARAEATRNVQGPVEVVDLRLVERAALTGRVVTTLGDPSSNPLVEAERREGESWRRSGEVELLAGGRFRIAEPPPGTYRIRAQEGDLRGETEVEVERGRIPRDVVVVLEPAARVVGRVLGAEDLLGSGLTVVVTREGAILGAGRVDGTGRYQVRGLGPGTWRLEVQDASGPLLAETVEIDRAGQTVDLDLDLDRGDTGAGLAGRVLLAGRPLAAGGVRLIPLEGGNRRWTTTTHDGRYRFDRLAPGRYRVQVTGRFAAPAEVAQVDLDGSEVLDLDLRAGAVRGRVVGPEGEPVPGARVVLASPEGSGGPSATAVVAGPDGRFEVERAVEGTYRLEATAGGRRADLGPLTLGEADVEGLVLTLSSAG